MRVRGRVNWVPTTSTLSNAAVVDCEVVKISQALSVAFVNAHVFTTIGEFTGLGFLLFAHAAAAKSERARIVVIASMSSRTRPIRTVPGYLNSLDGHKQDKKIVLVLYMIPAGSEVAVAVNVQSEHCSSHYM